MDLNVEPALKGTWAFAFLVDHLLGKKVGSENTCADCAAIRGTKCISLCVPMGKFLGIAALTVNGKTPLYVGTFTMKRTKSKKTASRF